MDDDENKKSIITNNHSVDKSSNWPLGRIENVGLVLGIFTLIFPLGVVCYTILAVVKTILAFADKWN